MSALMESPVSQCPASARQTTIANLPAELILMTPEQLPDVASLNNAVLSHSIFYNAFSAYENSIVQSVLKKEVTEETYTHAIVTHQLSNHRDSLPSFGLTDINEISAHVDKVREYRDLKNTRLSLADALTISRTAKRVTDLCHLFIQDCSWANKHHFIPLWVSVRFRRPSPSEIVRIQQAIYLFQMMTHLCHDWSFTREQDRDYLSDCQDKMSELQKCLVGQLMAPWEFHQVIAVQAYFRRALNGMAKHKFLSERIMPGLLAKGVDFIHYILHSPDWQHLDVVMEPFDREALGQPLHALGMVLSRGILDTWTRKQPQPYDGYKPFWADDHLGYESWKMLEDFQLKYFKEDPAWGDFFHPDSKIMEGRLDLWGAALWNKSRWAEISATLADSDGECWELTTAHWDPIAAGCRVVMHPEYVLED